MANADLGDLIGRGTTDSKPAAGIAGRLYYDTDLDKLQRDNGASWEDVERSDAGGGATLYTSAWASPPATPSQGDAWLPSNSIYLGRRGASAWAYWGPIVPVTPPPAATNWAWVNQHSGTIADSKGTLLLYDTGSNGLQVVKKACPTVPYTITAGLYVNFINPSGGNVQQVGLLFRESSSGKMHDIRLYFESGAFTIQSTKWTNEDTYSAAYASMSCAQFNQPLIYLRITDDNSNRVTSFSLDGVNFIQLSTIGRTDFLTADEVGLDMGTQAGSLYATLFSWTVS